MMVHPQNPNNGEPQGAAETPRFGEEIDSACSTPYVSAPSSPSRGPPAVAAGYFFSAPASPMHYVLSSSSSPTCPPSTEYVSMSQHDTSTLFEFEFSSRLSGDSSVAIGSMSSADELFLNGQIRPMKLSSHLQRPQILAPLINIEGEEEENEEASNGDDLVKRGRALKLRSRSVHRKARSLSPLRNAAFQWHDDDPNREPDETKRVSEGEAAPSNETTPSSSRSSSSRSSSSGRNSKKWVFLKDFLHRSKSEGRENGKEKFWSSISFSPSKEKKLPFPLSTMSKNTENAPEASKQKHKESKKAPARKSPAKAVKPANGVARRRAPVSAHELHYTKNRAQAEELKKRTYLPYRQGLFGCLGFSSKGYGALNGLAKTLNPVSSR